MWLGRGRRFQLITFKKKLIQNIVKYNGASVPAAHNLYTAVIKHYFNIVHQSIAHLTNFVF